MSKIAIEKAYDAYPLNESNRYNNEWHAKRVGYQKGYEQAEKDLALTWQDIARIDDMLREVESCIACSDLPTMGREDYYTEVLKRFNEIR